MNLDLFNNGVHSIYHSLLEIKSAEEQIETNKSFDHDDHIIHWKDSSGNTSFYLEGYNKPPISYGYKFVILNLIQGIELVLKAFLHDKTDRGIFRGKNGYTINLHDAIENTLSVKTELLSEEERNLLIRSSDIRNEMQHYEFRYDLDEIRELGKRLYFLASKVVLGLFEVDIKKYFEFDQWTDEEDVVVDVIKNLKTGFYTSG